MNVRSHHSDVAHPSSPWDTHPPGHLQDAASGGWALCPSLGPVQALSGADKSRAVLKMKDQRGQAEVGCLGSNQATSVSWFTSYIQEEEESMGQAKREELQDPVDFHSPI